jgi:predicted phage-related endonuclease
MGRMLAGKALENEVVQLVRSAYGDKLRDTGRVQRELIHPTLPFRAHPDGRIVGDHGDSVLEVKTASTAAFKRYEADGLPQHYLDQVQAQMGLSGLQSGVVVLVSRENLAELTATPVAFNAEHYRFLEGRARKAAPYLEGIETLPAGEPDRGFCFNCPFRNDCPEHQALKKAGEEGNVPDLIRLQLEAQMEELIQLEGELDPLQERVTELRTQIRETLLAYALQKVIVHAGTAAMVTSSRTSFDAKALQKEAPDLYTRYLKTTTFTNLRVKGTKPCLSTAS